MRHYNSHTRAKLTASKFCDLRKCIVLLSDAGNRETHASTDILYFTNILTS